MILRKISQEVSDYWVKGAEGKEQWSILVSASERHRGKISCVVRFKTQEVASEDLYVSPYTREAVIDEATKWLESKKGEIWAEAGWMNLLEEEK